MSDTSESLRRNIDSAGQLQSVVRTMKAMAASSITSYERAVQSLEDYYRTVQLALAAGFRQLPRAQRVAFDGGGGEGLVVAIVFGSDQGLVGPFNDQLLDFVDTALKTLPQPMTLWSVGQRIQSRLVDTAAPLGKTFSLPSSIAAITPLVGDILVELEAVREKSGLAQVCLFHNQPKAASVYAPVMQRLLPLDAVWERDLAAVAWPTKRTPEVMQMGRTTLLAFVREYLFVSLFRTCAESLASENASRLAAMQRAEKNIDELLDDLNRSFHRLRQNSIDEELFDVVSGFEALTQDH
jgi:F-type H+-transporting ATPase subunit gamma